jgi:hypothetical protein
VHRKAEFLCPVLAGKYATYDLRDNSTGNVTTMFIPSSNAMESIMTLCPIAIVSSCKQCALFAVCPLKSAIGDYDPEADKAEAKKTAKDTN